MYNAYEGGVWTALRKWLGSACSAREGGVDGPEETMVCLRG